MTAARLTIALGEYDTGWHDAASSIERAAGVVHAAAARGAELVVLPEMCTTGFTMEPERFAEPIGGESVAALGDIARTSGVHVLAGIATRDGGCNYNSAILLGPDGAVTAEYRKQRVFRFAGEDEHFTAGTDACIVDIGGVAVGIFICFDLRFPEIFRDVARDVHAMVILANWPASRRAHWDALVTARAIENQCYVAAVNRTGNGGGLTYDGGSVLVGPWGERVASAISGEPAIGVVDVAEVERVRASFPFLRDAR